VTTPDECDYAIELLQKACKDKYPYLMPEFIPIAKRWTPQVAAFAQKFVLNWLSSLKQQEE